MSVQLSTYVVPLLLVPWQTRVLTPEGYGRFSVAMAIMMYFISFAQYGFKLTVTPQISIHRDDRDKRSQLFWTTLFAQLVIATVGFVVLLALSSVVRRLADDRELLMIGYGAVLGTSLNPEWYMQGTENLVLSSIVTFSGRVLSLPAMFLLVHSTQDIDWAMGINSAVPLLTSVVVLTYLFSRREVAFVRTSVPQIVAGLRAGWQVFVAAFSVNFYAYTNTVVLGLVAGNVEAGYFAAADKLVKAALSTMSPLSSVAYPRISRLMHHARADAMIFLRKLLVAQGAIMLVVSVIIFASAPYVVKILYGAHYMPTIDVLRWMAFLPFLTGLTNIFGMQTMLPLGMQRQFSWILLASGALNIAMIYVLATSFGASGAAAAVLLTEAAVVTAMVYTLHAEGVVQSLVSR
jgi:PST family polysaccharide transporter